MQERMQERRARPLGATAPLLMAMPAVCAELEAEEEEEVVEEEERCRARWVGVMRAKDALIAN
jgi:hypothetical protein